MRIRTRWTIAVATAALALASLAPPAGAEVGAVCTWGGTPTEQTGTFSADPPISNRPAPTDLGFSATGPLEGDDPRCTGTMTFEGKLWQLSSCRFFVNTGTVTGVEGIGTYIDAGTGVSVGTLYAIGRSTVPVAAFNPLVMPSPEVAAACSSEEGLSGGAFSSVVVWLE